MSESINYNETIFLRLNSLSCELFVNTPDYKNAKNFLENHNLQPLGKDEKLTFLSENEESINGFEVISQALGYTSVKHVFLHNCLVCSDGKYYNVVRYSLPKSTKTSNKLY